MVVKSKDEKNVGNMKMDSGTRSKNIVRHVSFTNPCLYLSFMSDDFETYLGIYQVLYAMSNNLVTRLSNARMADKSKECQI